MVNNSDVSNTEVSSKASAEVDIPFSKRGHRAKTYFKDDSGAKIDYAELIRAHNDALMAGSPYPDAFYGSVCSDGKYHDVSEDTHWAPFLNASVNYINTKPRPWDKATEKLVVFIFGVVSHQVADILWHSLGIDQGFLRAMANINYHGNYGNAHNVGDFGGDILTEYEMNTSYIPLEEGWYIPSEDLYNIYNLFNGTKVKMPKDVIQGCSVILYLERLAEALGAKLLFTSFAAKSPFMVDQFERYFIGGVDDMAGWTHRIWQQTVTMIEQGTMDCDIPHSTLFLNCNGSLPRLEVHRDPVKNGYFQRHPLNNVSHDDVIVEETLRGIRIKPSNLYKAKLLKKTIPKSESKCKDVRGESRCPDRILFVKNDYVRLGEAYATGDLNYDGKPDLVVTAPGFGSVGSPQEGRVYIIYGDENGIPKSLNPDLDSLEATGQGQILSGLKTAQSRFGSSVAVMDINLDGADDIAIGAPAMTELSKSPLQYNGYVLIYFGLPKKKMLANGAANITITCNKIKYCNFGFSMTTGDVNSDGYPDLVIGSPFASKGRSEQAGFVTALLAGVYNLSPKSIDVGELKWEIAGNEAKLLKKTIPKSESKCKDVRGESRCPDRILFVKNDYARLGEAYATGDLNYDGKPDLVVTAPGFGSVGSPQEGRVYIIYGDENGIPKSLNPDLDSLEATGQGQILTGLKTAQSRFGSSVAVMDINLDGADDIAIGASAMTELSKSPLQYNGYVLIYFGLPKKKMLANGAANITITCNKIKYCNFGFSMTSGDVNNDGYPDLVIGSPFASTGRSEQAGFVTALLAGVYNLSLKSIDVGELKLEIAGNESYGWFGHSMSFGRWNNQNVLFVSQPEFRFCHEHPPGNCSYTEENATMSVGRIHAYFGTNLTQKWTAYGYNELSQTGWSVDIGSPYPDRNVQVVAVGQPGDKVNGSIVGVDYDFDQAGSVGLFSTTYGWPPSNRRLSVDHLIQGDRSYERFGAKVKFWDVNNDALSDLIIGAPFRTEDITEELSDPEQGQVYIYTGGEHFPFKAGCGNSSIHPCPKIQADFVLVWPGQKEKTRFGTNFAVLNSTNKRQVFVTAQHASDYARLGGAVGIFDFNDYHDLTSNGRELTLNKLLLCCISMLITIRILLW